MRATRTGGKDPKAGIGARAARHPYDHLASLFFDSHLWYAARVAQLFGWFKENWFSLSQVCGIIAGMLFTAFTIRQESRRRKIGDLLTLNQQHQVLWKEIQDRLELRRLLTPEVDLIAQPVSIAEAEFLNRAIVHFYVGWMLVRNGSLVRMDVFAKDVRAFFSLPVPRSVWDETKPHRDAQFVRFVERVLSRQ